MSPAADKLLPGSRASARAPRRTLVVDEPGLLREAVCALLESIPGIEVVGDARIGVEALRTAAALQAQIVVLELPSGSNNGPRLISTFKSQLPGLQVIVLTNQRGSIVEAALRAGADGYVLKSDSRADLFAAVAGALNGKRFISPSLRSHGSSKKVPDANPAAVAAGELTERELQVMRLIAAGRRTREIAKLLSLSPKTIEKHRASLMRRLGLRNASAVAAYAITTGLADENTSNGISRSK